MALTLTNVEEDRLLRDVVNKGGGGTDLTLHLFTNSATIGGSMSTASFTEASGSGYSSKTLTGTSWTMTPGAPSQAAYAQQTFTFTGALGNVYGYFVKRSTTTVWAETFSDGPYNIAGTGYEIKITPVITLGSTSAD